MDAPTVPHDWSDDNIEDNDGVAFCWERARSQGEVIIERQGAIAIYMNTAGQIVIRQDDWPEDDHFVIITTALAPIVIAKLAELAGEAAPPACTENTIRDRSAAERQRRYRERQRTPDATAALPFNKET